MTDNKIISMKRIKFMLIICFCFIYTTVFPQEQPRSPEISSLKNQIGIQLNPFVDEHLLDLYFMNVVCAIRYGFKLSNSITTGSEIYSTFPVCLENNCPVHYLNFRIGLFTRYSFLAQRRFQIFAEVAPYYSHSHTEVATIPEYKSSRFGIYGAPGISIYSRNKKFSLDLYYKFSNLTFINGKKSVFSYKVNFNF